MKRVLITGATGFIGQHCPPLLVARGYEVHAVSSRKIIANESNIHWHQIDLLNFPQMAALIAEVQPSHLLHVAWYTVPGKYWTSTENLRWVQASIGLLQEFVRHGGQRVVMAGTCAEYDWRYGYCSEAVTPLAPTTLYGICKHSLQLMLAAFSRQAGLSTAWGRIFFLFGPHEHPDRLVAYVIRSLLRGEPARCSHGRQIRDFLHVQDVANAFVALLESGVSRPVNIASGQPVALRELIYEIAAKFNRDDLIQLGAVSTPPDEPPLLVADVRCLHDELGWTPKYDLDTGLEQTIDWWKHEWKQ
jgi:nucleoside-diphosphate-sugar epimerase